jgi:hypothetical protein
MFFPESRVRVFLYGQPADMRKSFDGLYALARQGFDADPLAGHLFVFGEPPRHADEDSLLRSQRLGLVGQAIGGGPVHSKLV